MDQNTKEKTLENLTKSETILVAVSADSGLDGLAAGLAIYLSLLKLGKKVSILAKSPSVNDALTLYGVDQIGRLAGKQNLIVVVADAVDSVDKVTYLLEGDKLKIVIHALSQGRGLSPQQVSIGQMLSRPDLIFTFGFDSVEKLHKLITREQNIDSTAWLVSISKDDVSQNFAQANICNPKAASLCEITGQILQDLALPLDEDIAYNLYTGIAQATANFSPAKSTSESFQIASWLIKFGAGKASLAHQPMASFSQRQSPVTLSRTLPEEEQLAQDRQQLPKSFSQIPIEEVEQEKQLQQDWLRPPKIYKGSQAFNGKKN